MGDSLICESCNKAWARLYKTPHHQPGNPKVWNYCFDCKKAHEKEVHKLNDYWKDYLIRLKALKEKPSITEATVAEATPVE